MMNSHFLVPGPACAVGAWAPSFQSSAQGAKNAHQRKEPTPVGPDTGRDTRLLRMSPALREPRIEALTRLHKASWAHVWARRRIRCVPLRIGDGDHYTCTWPLESHLTPWGSGLGIVFILVRAAQRYRAAPVSPVEWTKVTGARHRTFLVVDGTAVLRPLSVDLLVLSERDVEVGDDHDLWDGISHGERVSRGCRAAHHGHAFLEARASILCFCGAPCDQLGVMFASAAGFLAPGLQQQESAGSKIVTASSHRVAINLKRKPSAGVPCNTSQHIAAEVEQHLQTCVVACNLQDNEREGSETSVRGGTAAGHLVMRTLKPSQHVQ